MSSLIGIRNKLEVRAGGVIMVPGCEPTSSLTAVALTRNWNCNSSVISVQDALNLIPGSKLEKVMTPVGSVTTGYFFVLPEWSPPPGNNCPESCYPDWYAILRENAQDPTEEEETTTVSCSGFNYSGCVSQQDPLRAAPVLT